MGIVGQPVSFFGEGWVIWDNVEMDLGSNLAS